MFVCAGIKDTLIKRILEHQNKVSEYTQIYKGSREK